MTYLCKTGIIAIYKLIIMSLHTLVNIRIHEYTNT